MFASMLDLELNGCHGINLTPEAYWCEVSGILNLSHDDCLTNTSARCVFKVTPSWISDFPRVKCLESWVRLDPDWHTGIGDNRDELCFVLDEEWRDLVSKVCVQDGQVAASRYAAAFCLRNVRWLLYRHYIGFKTNMTTWPRDWPARPHGDKAYRQYQQEKNQKEKMTQ